MDFFDEESRPRFLLQSRSPPKPTHNNNNNNHHLHKPTLFISLSLSALFLTLSVFYFQSDPFQSLFIWVSLSLLIGPFAPSSLTAGDIRVGLGPTLQPQENDLKHAHDQETSKRSRNKPRKQDYDQDSVPLIKIDEPQRPFVKIDETQSVVEEKDWSLGDLELLRKQMVKCPVGMPGRWEAVAGVFGGRHKVESVVKMAKLMGDKKMNDMDSFSRFLKDRKAVDKRVDDVIESEREGVSVGGGSWSSGEDIALLNALKAFPKEAAMRWEKITAAVPGRSKAACMKRVADLKKDFRTTKASSQA